MLATDKQMSELPFFERPIRPVYARPFCGLLSLAQSSWWERIWTVQEIVLLPAATVYWGSISMPWEILHDAAKFLDRHIFANCCRSLWKDLPPDLVKILTGFYTPFFTIAYLREREPSYMAPIQCLWHFQHRGATDPRDKAFRLLGLISDWDLLSNNIDYYSLNTVQFYQYITFALIEFDNTLISMTGRRGEPLGSTNTASWVIDWPRPPLQGTGFALYMAKKQHWYHGIRFAKSNADNGMGVGGVFGLKDGVLLLDGFCVDKIVLVGEPMQCDGDGDLERRDLLMRIQHWREVIRQREPSDGAYIKGGTRETAFRDPLVGNLVLEGFLEMNFAKWFLRTMKRFRQFVRRRPKKMNIGKYRVCLWFSIRRFLCHGTGI
jgi:hypothetical protein